MKKLRQKDIFPVSKRSLAAYLGISHSMLSLSESANSSRTLSTAAFSKKLALMQAHVRKDKPGIGEGFERLRKQKTSEGSKLARAWKRQAGFSAGKVPILQEKLDTMKEKYEEDIDWLKTVEMLISELPEDAYKGDKTWLFYQQAITVERLKRNSIIAQAELQLEIEMEEAKGRVYREGSDRLMSGFE